MEKHVALFEVKALNGDDPSGEFEAVLSVPVVDRDGEVIDAGAFEPLPAEIPIHKYHDFSAPVATAVPFYDGDVLKARGVFDPDADSQAIRQKVGRSIRYMSVGFMAAERADQDGVPHITRAELLEASFVSVPSNREAAILAVKAHAVREEAKGTKGERLQQIHDLAVANGALCSAAEKTAAKTAATDPEEKAADPAAAEAAAGSAADPPAEATAGHQLRVALLRLEADLAAMNAAT